MPSETFNKIKNAQAGNVTKEQIREAKIHLEALNVACHQMPTVMGLDRPIIRDTTPYQAIPPLPDNANGAQWREHNQNMRNAFGLLAKRCQDLEQQQVALKQMFHEYSLEFLGVVSELGNIVFASFDPDDDDDDDDDDAAEVNEDLNATTEPDFPTMTQDDINNYRPSVPGMEE